MQIMIVSRLWFCRRPWRFKINIKRNSVHFRKSHVCANKVGCAGNRLQFHTVLQKLKSFLSICVWTVFPALTLSVLVIEVFHSVPNRTDGPKREPRRNPSAIVKPKMHNPIPTQAHQRHSNLHWSHSTKYSAFWFQCYVKCLWGQWGRNQNDYQRSKSHNGTWFTDPRCCSGLVVWQD